MYSESGLSQKEDSAKNPDSGDSNSDSDSTPSE